MRSTLLLAGTLVLVVACSESTGPEKSTPAFEIVVSPFLPEVGIGDTLRLSAEVTDSLGNVLTKKVIWTSSDESRATVSATGLVTAHDFGESVITASVDGKSGISTVIVKLTLAQLSANNLFACGVTTTGRTYCWGSNDYGELGNGDNSQFPREFPTRIATTIKMKQVTTGAYHACALSLEGAAYCWGMNGFGQLGNGTYDATFAPHPMPAPVAGGRVFTSLSAGYLHTCGIATNGAAYCWGDNEAAQLGSGGTETCILPTNVGSTPVPCGRTPRVVNGGASFSVIAAGTFHSCGISTNGDANCWGDNSNGQRGLGFADTVTRFESTIVSGGRKYSTITSGDGFSCALATDAQAWCWGYNEVASLGIGSGDTLPHPTPQQVVGGAGLTSIAASWYHVCGTNSSGAALCWGLNADVQAGTAAGTCSVRDPGFPSFPIDCITSATAVTSPVSFVSMVPGFYSTCGRTAKSGVYCWGWNGYGQLGNGSTASSIAPVPIFGSPIGSTAPRIAGPTLTSAERTRLERALFPRSRGSAVTRVARRSR